MSARIKGDSLGDRMKENYESVTKTRLIRRMPVIIRIDGCHFHTFCKHFRKPFDKIMVKTMQDTMKYLCENIQGCVLGYTQSDEITLLLIDYRNLESSSWFGNELQKVVSVSASMATMAFNRFYSTNVAEMTESDLEFRVYASNIGMATFDSRAFNIPENEVANCFLWRQLDAERNSVQSCGQAEFTAKQLHGKSCKDIVSMLEEQKGIVWGNLAPYLKRGSCCIRVPDKDRVDCSHWEIDLEIPRFIGSGRNYIEDLIPRGIE